MGALIPVAIILSIGFNTSWWRQSDPVASDQQEVAGQSMFTQGGIDYSAKRGVVKISLAADRPTAFRLGLPQSGTRTIGYIVPVTIDVSNTGPAVRQQLADQVKIQTSDGRISAVYFLDDHAYSVMYQHAVDLIAATGTAADRQAFDAALADTRTASKDKRYDARSVTVRAGVRLSIELAGTPSTSRLTIRLTPA
jgi:hypothetical protein